MADTAISRRWPSGIDESAELQLNLLEYQQPSARGPPTQELSDKPQDVAKGKRLSSLQLTGKGEDNGDGQDRIGEQENNGAPEAETTTETILKNEDNQSDGKGHNTESEAPPDPETGYPKEYYDSPDLKVMIKDKPDSVSFLVSSHALAIASKEWRSKLSPINFKNLESHPFEASSDGVIKVLCLDGVDPLSLDIIFRITHWKTEDLPQHLTFDALRELAITCEKYSCARVLNPWPLVWMEEYEEQAILPGFENWMFVAQTLDTKNPKVREISRQMILEVSSISKCGTYLRRDVRGPEVAAHTIEVEVNLIPPKILEYVLRERKIAVDQVIASLRQFVSNLTNSSSNSGSFGLTGEELCRDETCSDIALGSLLRSLKALNLWPLLRSGVPQEWHGSITTLVMQIENIRMSTFLKAGDTDKPTSAVTTCHSLEPQSEPTKPKNPLKHQPKPKKGLPKRLGAYTSPTASESTDLSSPGNPPQEESAKTHPPNNIDPVPPLSTGDTGEAAFNLYDNKIWESPLFGGMLYTSATGDQWAAAMRELRYEHPAFAAKHQYRGKYRPCSSAFALGELITECRQIVTDISMGGYQAGF
ncbi:hypothetical protein TWF718_000062 [Orbilia javanica]|uniref:BTB domain-containing protein n=1 Tax=Orbilia javanica TaxID=47235 RepID=A0AAN8NDW2_9PEZI